MASGPKTKRSKRPRKNGRDKTQYVIILQFLNLDSQDNASVPSPRRERDKRLRVEDFLRAAERLFAEKGYRQTTMEDIARLAEYGTGTIYRYFDSKEALYGELLERKMAAYLDHLLARYESETTPRGKLRALLHGRMDFFGQNREFMRIFVKEFVPECSTLAAGLTPEARELRARCLELMRETIEAGVRSGDFKPVDPGLAVAAISGLANEMLLHCIREMDGEHIGEVESVMMSFIENGLVSGERP